MSAVFSADRLDGTRLLKGRLCEFLLRLMRKFMISYAQKIFHFKNS